MLAWSKMEDQFREWMKDSSVSPETDAVYLSDTSMPTKRTGIYMPPLPVDMNRSNSMERDFFRTSTGNRSIHIRRCPYPNRAAGFPSVSMSTIICLEVGEDEGQAAIDLLQLLTQESPNYRPPWRQKERSNPLLI